MTGNLALALDPGEKLTMLETRRYAQNVLAYPRIVGQVRRVVEAHLRRWGRVDLREPISLCTAEMLANVAKHSGSLACVLVLEDTEAGVRLTVSDSSKELPRVREVNWLAESGRGMRLVAATASSFGYTLTETGKDVWALFLVDGETA